MGDMSAARPSFLSQPVVKNVMVYRNGDPFYTGRKLVINEKKVTSFEVFLGEVTGGVQAPFGAVRNLYTPRQGHRVNRLEDLQSGQHYVAAGAERFKKLDYIQIGLKKRIPVQTNIEIKPVAHSRIIASARFKRPLQEPCTIFLINNGDVLNPAVRLLIPSRCLAQWDKVLELITEKLRNRTGAVHRLHTLDGRLVSDGDELENGQFYVAVGRGKFKKLPYSDLIFNKPAYRRRNGSKAASLPPITGSKKYKEGVNDRQVKSGGESTNTENGGLSLQTLNRKGKKEPPSLEEGAYIHRRHFERVLNKNYDFEVEEEDDFPNDTRKYSLSRILHSAHIDHDDGVFKAYQRSQTPGATEVQEDEETQVELPVDQRLAYTVDEEPTKGSPEEESSGEEDKDLQPETTSINEHILHESNRDNFPTEETPDERLLSNDINDPYEDLIEPNGEGGQSYDEEEEGEEEEEEEPEDDSPSQHLDGEDSVALGLRNQEEEEEEELSETESPHVEDNEDQLSLKRSSVVTPEDEIPNPPESERQK